MQMSKTFPLRLKHDVEFVMNIIANNSYSSISITFSLDSFTTYQLKDEKVEIPYRMYYKEISDTVLKTFNETQFKILCCLYTRHNDGYIRQKYLEKLFDMNIDEWELPFIVKLCDEYILEILELIYNKLANRTNDDIKQFCLNNENIIYRGYERMMSYWNAYYRHKGYLFRSYVGRKIFREYLGYDKEFRMDKILKRLIVPHTL